MPIRTQLHGHLQQPTKTTTSAIPVPYFTGGALLASPYRVRRLPMGLCSSVWRNARTAISAELLLYSRSKVHSSTRVSTRAKVRHLHRDKVSGLRTIAEEEVQLLMYGLLFFPKTGTPRRTFRGPSADQCCRQRPKGATHKLSPKTEGCNTQDPQRRVAPRPKRTRTGAKPSRTMELARKPTPPMAVE